MEWADKVRKLRVRANADTPLDARTAHREARTSGGVTQQEIDRLEGRLHAQLFRLRERVAAARKRGEVLPTVQASRMRTVTSSKCVIAPCMLSDKVTGSAMR